MCTDSMCHLTCISSFSMHGLCSKRCSITGAGTSVEVRYGCQCHVGPIGAVFNHGYWQHWCIQVQRAATGMTALCAAVDYIYRSPWQCCRSFALLTSAAERHATAVKAGGIMILHWRCGITNTYRTQAIHHIRLQLRFEMQHAWNAARES